MVKQNTTKVACCSRRQKIWGVIALAGLFACGLMVGLALHAGGRSSTVELAANTNDTEPDTADKETCEVIEDFLLRRINPIDSDQVTAHSMNVEIYQILIENGCPENSEKYQALMQQESAILDILINRQMPENSRTCSNTVKLASNVQKSMLTCPSADVLKIHSSMRNWLRKNWKLPALCVMTTLTVMKHLRWSKPTSV